jgi:hypothetical protein
VRLLEGPEKALDGASLLSSPPKQDRVESGGARRSGERREHRSETVELPRHQIGDRPVGSIKQHQLHQELAPNVTDMLDRRR